MGYQAYIAQDPREMAFILNGGYRAPRPAQVYPLGADPSQLVFEGMNGLTLVFTTPAVTVTFATANPASAVDILAEINTQAQAVDANFQASLLAEPNGVRRLQLVTTTSGGFVLNAAASTAAAALGLPDTGTLTSPSVDPTSHFHGGDLISGGLYVITNT
jgi:hypothetical protein